MGFIILTRLLRRSYVLYAVPWRFIRALIMVQGAGVSGFRVYGFRVFRARLRHSSNLFIGA